ncbi:MAG: hypothetical protein JWN86_3467 [Planctomycetota bacterium]|nr:hypothetical protein [Planctomycetota bacterium]
MATQGSPENSTESTDAPHEPSVVQCILAVALCLAFAVGTRLPVARSAALDFDEVGFLAMIHEADFPKHHTLFLATAKVLGAWAADEYRGFIWLDIVISGLAMAATWWFLRAVVAPRTAASAAVVLGVAPVFWSYGAMAGNYTAIPLVGSTLLGIAVRGRFTPRPWHPYAAAAILAWGAGYRQDIGLFWLPVFLVILWRHRWIAGLQAGLLFTILNLAWFIPMLRDAGGWATYRAQTGEFADKAGRMNSVWQLGLIDASLRYAVKIALALSWTLGIGLLFVPRGLTRLAHRDGGPFLIATLILAAIPAMAMHLLVHFGVAGYAFHYVPGLMVLMALGLGREVMGSVSDSSAARRGLALAATLAALFLFYPTNLDRTDLRGQFDLACARHTRVGLATKPPMRDIDLWRTTNSQRLPENTIPRPTEARKSLLQIWGR